MPQVSKSIEISAPRERVFQEAADPVKQPDWALLLNRVELTQGDGRTLGSKQAWQFKVGPRAQNLEATVTRFVENEYVSREATGALALEESMNFVALDPNLTRVHWTFEYTPPLGRLGRLLDLVLVNRVFQNDVETSLEALKARLET